MPSLYETTAVVGDVASSNFTTLYNASNLTVPNVGAGSVSGNLNIAGNLTVQGTSLLQGAVNLGSTLCLPNYCFPLPDGTTNQVMTTDGSGNLYWANVTSLPGANYVIEATATTGGANLALVSSLATDNVKFAEGNDISIVRTDANTITISSTALPNGTARGEVLVWDGTDWIADAEVRADNAANRLTVVYENSGAGTDSAFRVRKDYGSTNYSEANDDGTGINFGVTSTAQGSSTYGAVSFRYSATNPEFRVATSINNFTNSLAVLVANGNELTIAGTTFKLNADHTGAPTADVSMVVERGTSTDATLTWDETQDRWEFNNPLEVQGQITGTSNLDLNGNTITLLSGTTGAPSSNAQIVVDRGSSTDAVILWDETDDRWELDDPVFITDDTVPLISERQKTTADFPYESKSSLRLIQRVTDAPNNQTDDGGTNITYSRTSGTSGGPRIDYGSLQFDYYGTTNTAEFKLQWSDDNFNEPTPGQFPGTYVLQKSNATETTFFNNSLYIDYTTNGAAQVGINTNTPGYTLDVNGDAHVDLDLTVDGDLFLSGYQIDLNSATQGDVLYYNGTAFVNSNNISTADAGNRLVVEYQNSTAGVSTPLFLRKNYTTSTFTNNDGVAMLFQLDSNTQPVTGYAGISTLYDSTNPKVRLTSSTDNYTTALTLAQFDSTDVLLDATNLTLNANGGSSAAVNAQITVERGTTGADSYFKWDESIDYWTASINLKSEGNLVADGNLYTNGDLWLNNDNGAANAVITFRNPSGDATLAFSNANQQFEMDHQLFLTNNSDLLVSGDKIELLASQPAADSFLYFTSTEYLQWDNTAGRFEFTDDLDVAGDITTTGLTAGNVRVGVATDNTIDTTTGNLTLDSTGGTVAVNDNLNVDSGVLYVDAANNRVGVNKTNPTEALDVNGNITTNGNTETNTLTVDSRATVDTQVTSTSSTATVAIATTTRNALKCIVRIVDNVSGNNHIVEALVLKTGATAMLTTYAEMYNASSLAAFTADVSGSDLRLLATPASANNTTISVVNISLT